MSDALKTTAFDISDIVEMARKEREEANSRKEREAVLEKTIREAQQELRDLWVPSMEEEKWRSEVCQFVESAILEGADGSDGEGLSRGMTATNPKKFYGVYFLYGRDSRDESSFGELDGIFPSLEEAISEVKEVSPYQAVHSDHMVVAIVEFEFGLAGFSEEVDALLVAKVEVWKENFICVGDFTDGKDADLDPELEERMWEEHGDYEDYCYDKGEYKQQWRYRIDIYDEGVGVRLKGLDSIYVEDSSLHVPLNTNIVFEGEKYRMDFSPTKGKWCISLIDGTQPEELSADLAESEIYFLKQENKYRQEEANKIIAAFRKERAKSPTL